MKLNVSLFLILSEKKESCLNSLMIIFVIIVGIRDVRSIAE